MIRECGSDRLESKKNRRHADNVDERIAEPLNEIEQIRIRNVLNPILETKGANDGTDQIQKRAG